MTIIFLGSLVTNQEGVLMTELLDGYKPDIKPARNANTPINITFNFELYRIEGLVSESQ